MKVVRIEQLVRESTRRRDRGRQGPSMIAVWRLTLACGHETTRSAGFDNGGFPPHAPVSLRCSICEGGRTK